MLSEEIKKRFEERIIKWLTIEKEVMDEVNKMFLEGDIDEDDWNEYFVSMVNTHGTNIMVAQIKAFIKIQEGFKEILNFKSDKDIGLEDATSYIPTYMNTKEKEGKFEDLHGNLYDPVIKNGVYVCPKCKGHIVPLNLHQNDPDSYYYRCVVCKIDFKIINKPSKDFIFTR